MKEKGVTDQSDAVKQMKGYRRSLVYRNTPHRGEVRADSNVVLFHEFDQQPSWPKHSVRSRTDIILDKTSNLQPNFLMSFELLRSEGYEAQVQRQSRL
jgi:hypothetical protein